MKKLFISISIFLNVAFLIIACTKKDMQAPVEKAPAADAAFYEGSLADYSDHYHGLTFNQVTQMLDNYEGHQSAVINATMGITDARSCWFSLKDIKNFMGHLEAEVQKNRAVNIDGLGIRFYYGAHSNPSVLPGIPSNYAGLHNLVMIPTYKDVKGIDTDFDPYYVDRQTGIPMPLDLLRANKKASKAVANAILGGDGSDTGDYEVFSMDHGHLYPPYDTVHVNNN